MFVSNILNSIYAQWDNLTEKKYKDVYYRFGGKVEIVIQNATY